MFSLPLQTETGRNPFQMMPAGITHCSLFLLQVEKALEMLYVKGTTTIRAFRKRNVGMVVALNVGPDVGTTEFPVSA